jgi:hypothetical protein
MPSNKFRSIREKSSLPVWYDYGIPQFKENSYSHGIRHQQQATEPFSNKIDEHLVEKIYDHSDPFTNIHVGKHILFAGCSVTEPAGIKREKGWAQQTYKRIADKEQTSGFYNICVGGSSIALQISLIFKYIANYGKPDTILFNMPASTRTLSNKDGGYSIKNNELIRDGLMVDSSVSIEHEYRYPGSMLMAEFFNFELYRSLHEYCKGSNTQLISFTWADYAVGVDSGTTETLFRDKFDTFYTALNENFLEFTNEYIANPINESETLLIADDGYHPGDAEQAYYADFAFKIYESLN